MHKNVSTGKPLEVWKQTQTGIHYLLESEANGLCHLVSLHSKDRHVKRAELETSPVWQRQ